MMMQVTLTDASSSEHDARWLLLFFGWLLRYSGWFLVCCLDVLGGY